MSDNTSHALEDLKEALQSNVVEGNKLILIRFQRTRPLSHKLISLDALMQRVNVKMVLRVYG